MSLDAWLTVAFTALVLASYALWAVDRLPRMRRVLVLATVVSLAAAVWLHGDLLSAPDTKPVKPGPASDQ